MARWDITGLWTGEYSYDPNPDVAELPPPNGFTFTTWQGWFGRVRGRIQDHPPHGNPHEAAVWGWVNAVSIRFRKQYPALYCGHGRHRRTIAEEFTAQGYPPDWEVPQPPVRYAGQYDPTEDVLRGTWRIPRLGLRFRSRGRWVRFVSAETTGRWFAQRHSKDVEEFRR